MGPGESAGKIGSGGQSEILGSESYRGLAIISNIEPKQQPREGETEAGQRYPKERISRNRTSCKLAERSPRVSCHQEFHFAGSDSDPVLSFPLATAGNHHTRSGLTQHKRTILQLRRLDNSNQSH